MSAKKQRKKKKDHNSTWHTFQRVLKKQQHSYTFAQYIHIHIYMHIKHQKTEEVGRCLASLWLKQTVNNVSFRLLGVVVCCEAVLAQGARPSQPDHVHEPPPKSTGEEKLLNWCIVPELDPGGDELSRSEASASVWACRRSWSAILFPSGVSPQLLINIVEGKRMENQEVGGLSNMTEVVFVLNRGGEGCCRVGGAEVWRGRWVVAGEDRLSLWVGGGVLALLGTRLGLQVLVVLGLDVLVLVRGDGTPQVGPVGRQNHQVVDLKRNGIIYVMEWKWCPIVPFVLTKVDKILTDDTVCLCLYLSLQRHPKDTWVRGWIKLGYS